MSKLTPPGRMRTALIATRQWLEQSGLRVPHIDDIWCLLGEGEEVEEAGEPIYTVPDGTMETGDGEADLIENVEPLDDPLPTDANAVSEFFKPLVDDPE